MLLPLILLLQAATPQSRYDACVALTRSDPAKAVATADAWRIGGGGLPARQCLGLAFVAQERFGPAVIAFEQAAQEAEIQRDGRAATLWVQAANAALAGDDAAKARNCLDRALALPVLAGPLRGEALLDRGRADVALGDTTRARADIDEALTLVAADPMAWLLSATLARRTGDAPRATKDIAEALRLAGDDAAVQFEAGNIAALAGRDADARTAWEKAAKIAPASPAGQAATKALAGQP
ncbi:tetratricopeptide repeat protein [Sphingomonas jatrophae]|uniref:Tetratricopeptide repeat-containing protein n=1 Tax=Sphingomonas jatrophae TaxID=1166337 RepID=A0A1I6LN20_9SPHN|nr:hypothetical protein [Sphingomonas jatrophae]SFS04841.1 Tetratricopeptide repeat-containing protein [Sphingomonas jatrophae]